MKVEFRKVSRNNSPFTIKIENITVNGFFKKLREYEVEVFYDMQGSIKHTCDRCGEDFDLICNQSSTLLISDGEYSGQELDVIESFDHNIDIDYIINSELEAFKSDYHYCEKCINNIKE